MQRSVADWGGNLVAFAVLLLFNILSNTLPFNDQSQAEISARYPSLLTPAGFTFSIWGLIYVVLLGFVVWQALPAQRESAKVARISRLFQLNCALNATWLVAWHYDYLALSMLVMLAILGTLALIYRRLLASLEDAPVSEHLALYLPFSMYTAWVSVATLVNASIVQLAGGWANLALSAVEWTLFKLAIAGAIGATMIVKIRDVPFALVIAWAAYGISVMQSATPAVSAAAQTLSVLMLLLVLVEAAARLARRKFF